LTNDVDVNDKNLLIISHTYNDFVKDQTETIAQFFNTISVCVRYNIALKYLSYLPVQRFKNYTICRHLDVYNIPQNIKVYPSEIFYLPSDSQDRKLGNLHLSQVKKNIEKNKIQFDLIHSHFTWSAGYAGARIKEEFSTPLVVTAHGYDIYSLPFKDDDWKEKIEYVLNTADRIITVSKSNLACIEKLNVSTPVTVIPNGFSRSLFSPCDLSECRKVLNLPQDKKIVLSVGMLEPVKGHIYLIDALQHIIKKRKDILCVIVGGGGLRGVLEREIRSRELENYIILAGSKPHNEISLWINACDLFVLPSLNEGNPTVMFEALGCGKPFVGTNVGGVPDVIISDTFGLLVRPSDGEDLAEKILVALDYTWDREAILRYADHFTWDEISKEIMKIYHSVL
jgi:glycosyltransferase involved in cell wall biosynthesis